MTTEEYVYIHIAYIYIYTHLIYIFEVTCLCVCTLTSSTLQQRTVLFYFTVQILANMSTHDFDKYRK